MYVVTGGAGFIGSNLAKSLTKRGYNLIICDKKKLFENNKYITNKEIYDLIEPEYIFKYLNNNINIKVIFHMGANSSTTETNGNLIWMQNIFFTLNLWKWCAKNNVRFIYASSAATYGDGTNGFSDKDDLEYLKILKPLNIYGWTKSEIDLRIKSMLVNQYCAPPQWVGLKFFNVYGPNEYHKKNMVSLVYKAFNDVISGKPITLFKSHNPLYEDGKQLRDFIYVSDCIDIMLWILDNYSINGIINCGTGRARSFIDLAKATFSALSKEININFIETPMNIRQQYQYKTEADIKKLTSLGYKNKFTSLEDGVKIYIQNHLINK